MKEESKFSIFGDEHLLTLRSRHAPVGMRTRQSLAALTDRVQSRVSTCSLAGSRCDFWCK